MFGVMLCCQSSGSGNVGRDDRECAVTGCSPIDSAMAGGRRSRICGRRGKRPRFRQALIVDILGEKSRIYEDEIGGEVCLRCGG